MGPAPVSNVRDIGSSNPAPCAQCGVWMPRPRTWYLGRPCCRGCLSRVVIDTPMSTSWMESANCSGSKIDFYPELTHRTDITVQRLVCRSCQVQTDCLTYAIRMREAHGIWGGMTPMERWDFAKRNNMPTWSEEGDK